MDLDKKTSNGMKKVFFKLFILIENLGQDKRINLPQFDDEFSLTKLFKYNEKNQLLLRYLPDIN